MVAKSPTWLSMHKHTEKQALIQVPLDTSLAHRMDFGVGRIEARKPSGRLHSCPSKAE